MTAPPERVSGGQVLAIVKTPDFKDGTIIGDKYNGFHAGLLTGSVRLTRCWLSNPKSCFQAEPLPVSE